MLQSNIHGFIGEEMLLNINKLILECGCSRKSLDQTTVLGRRWAAPLMVLVLAGCAGTVSDPMANGQDGDDYVVSKASDADTLHVAAKDAPYPFTDHPTIWTTGRDSDIEVLPANGKGTTRARRTAPVSSELRKNQGQRYVQPADRVPIWKGLKGSESKQSAARQEVDSDIAFLNSIAPAAGPLPTAAKGTKSVEVAPRPLTPPAPKVSNPAGEQAPVLTARIEKTKTSKAKQDELAMLLPFELAPKQDGHNSSKPGVDTAVKQVSEAPAKQETGKLAKVEQRASRSAASKRDFTSLGRISTDSPLTIGAPAHEKLVEASLGSQTIEGGVVAGRTGLSNISGDKTKWSSPLLSHVETKLSVLREETERDIARHAATTPEKTGGAPEGTGVALETVEAPPQRSALLAEIEKSAHQPEISAHQPEISANEVKASPPRAKTPEKPRKSKELVAQVSFDRGSSLLSPKDQTVLAQVVDQHQSKGGIVWVVGHGDKPRNGEAKPMNAGQAKVSSKRAKAVADALISLGVKPQDLRSEGLRGERTPGALVPVNAGGAEIFLAQGYQDR